MAESTSCNASYNGYDFRQLIQTDGGANTYNQWASSYDCDMTIQHYEGYVNIVSKWKSYHATALQPSSAGEKHKIFDAGCGTGLVGEYILTVVPRDRIELYGGDVSDKMLERASKKAAYTDLRVVNLKQPVPYEVGSFDSVLCAGVLAAGQCGIECLPNMIEVLRKGGYLFATVNVQIYNTTTKPDWEKLIRDYNCQLIEENEMPHIDNGRAVLLVIKKL